MEWLKSGVRALGSTILKNQPEKEIQKLFVQYEKTLADQKAKHCDDITRWGDTIVSNIYQYVNQQKCLVEQEYVNQIEYLNKTCQQFVEELRVHEEMDNTGQINQLLDRCKALKIELVALEYHGQTIPFIEVPNKALVAMDRNDFHVIDTVNDKFANNSTVKDDNKTEDNINTHSKLYPNIPITSAKRTE